MVSQKHGFAKHQTDHFWILLGLPPNQGHRNRSQSSDPKCFVVLKLQGSSIHQWPVQVAAPCKGIDKTTWVFGFRIHKQLDQVVNCDSWVLNIGFTSKHLLFCVPKKGPQTDPNCLTLRETTNYTIHTHTHTPGPKSPFSIGRFHTVWLYCHYMHIKHACIYVQT